MAFLPWLFESNDDSARDFYGSHKPSAGIDERTVTELSFKEARQSWVDACTGDVKSNGIFHNRTTAATNCAGQFDSDPDIKRIKSLLTERATAEKANVIGLTSKNTQTLLKLIGGFFLLGVLFYLFFSK
jgi:hypothetical protein